MVILQTVSLVASNIYRFVNSFDTPTFVLMALHGDSFNFMAMLLKAIIFW